MADGLLPRVRAFYDKYLPIGDRLGEMFYAVWMAVISLGLLGTTELNKGAVALVIFVAFVVNITWGLIDGISVMHSNIIRKARVEKVVYDLQTKNDETSRKLARQALDGQFPSNLGADDKEKIIDIIATHEPGEDPSKKRYYPNKDDWRYAMGILAIDFFLVIPLIVPLLILTKPMEAIYASRLIATVMFALLGVAYAKNLNRRRWVAALFLGTLCFSVFTLAFLAGW